MAILLDITRFFSRIGRPFDTGIDRVERAFFQHILDQDCGDQGRGSKDHGSKDRAAKDGNALFLIQAGSDSFLLDANAARAFANAEANGNFGTPRGLDRWRKKRHPLQRAALSFLRANATRLGSDAALGKEVSGRFEPGFRYLNVGHSNLRADLFKALRQAGCKEIQIFVHDLIPMTHPAFCRADQRDGFQRKMQAVADHGDKILTNSAVTAASIASHLPQLAARNIPVKTVPLATDRPTHAHDPAPKTQRPYFCVIGTIEPRKNHAFLFELWEKLAARLNADAMPQLCVIGARGWADQSVFDWLDRNPVAREFVTECNALSDQEMFGRLAGARALLFPSVVEGFGLPALEAQVQRVPIIASPLQVFEEFLGNYPTYCGLDDAGLWLEEIIRHLNRNVRAENDKMQVPKPLSWNDYFDEIDGFIQ